MIKIPGEGQYAYNTTNTETKSFLARLFEAIIARITKLFESIVGKKQSGVDKVASLDQRVKKVDLREDAKASLKLLQTIVKLLKERPEEKVGKEFTDSYEKLPSEIKHAYSNFYKMFALKSHARTLSSLNHKEIAPFFNELERLGRNS